MNKGLIATLLVLIFTPAAVLAAGDHGWHEDEVIINLSDHYSIQRGAKAYVNYCQGCHSLKYVRFSRLAEDAKILTNRGEVLEEVLRKNLMFTTDKIGDPIKTAMLSEDAKKWFGAAPPDLSLIARQRGKDWLYTYLRTFYRDDVRPWGVNNAIFPDVAMPHVFEELQGIQKPIYKTITKSVDGKEQKIKVLERLEQVTPGKLSPKEYDLFVTDLVNFLAYAAEPMKLERQRVGIWVLLFLIVFGAFAYLLKREYWKDVH